MKRAMAFVCACLAAGACYAKLPPPTPEEQAAAAKKKAQAAEQAKEQQAALERVQDQIAAKFGKHGGGSGTTQAGDLPRKAVEPPGTAGPHGGTTQSAEAHSAPAH
jgi:hypothetical protein